MNANEFIESQKNNYNAYKLPEITPFHYVYDFLIYLFHNFPHKEANKEIHKIAREFKLKNKKILDIGFYTGYKSFYLFSERNSIIGIDQSETMYKYAEKRYRFYDIEFLLGELTDLLKSNIQNESIDFVHCNVMPLHYDTGVIENSPYFKEVMSLFMKKIAKKGIIYYTFYTIKSKKVLFPISEEALIAFLKDNNITNYTLRINECNKFNNPVIECIISRNDK
ncbi:MAG TPA: methyltransferase domain-containing protein [Bacteroidales bacterium]|nr:methyltransferase domain-containing protein [Bacteroidales bacterium]